MKKPNNKNKSSKNIILGIILLLLIMLTLLGIAYGFYRTRVVGNSNEKSIGTVNKKLELVYSDNKAVLEAIGVEPGYKDGKTFSVTNNGDETDYFSIKIENVENNFDRREDWTYKIYRLDSEEDSNLTENKPIKSGMLPNTESWLVYKEEIGIGETQYYRITIEYENLTEIDQSEDMGKSLSFKINIDNEIDNEFTNAKEGTLLAAIARDNAISETLTIPVEQVSKIKNKLNGFNESEQRYTITEENKELYYAYSDSYTFDEVTGHYTLINPIIGKYNDIKDNLEGKYILNLYGVKTEKEVKITNPLKSSIFKVKTVNDNSFTYIKNKEPIRVGIEQELSYTEDDYGTSYYFRGLVENNYVTMGNTCWRIVQVNSKGDIKITLYDENQSCDKSTNEATGTNALISEDANGGAKVTVMYGTPKDNYVRFKDSEIKNKLEEWYESKRLSDYNNIIKQNAEWCDDVSIYEKTDSYTSFGFRGREAYSKKASLKCKNLENGLDESIYTGKIALLTGDETLLTGFSFYTEPYATTFNYLSEGAGLYYWLMSPFVTGGSGFSLYEIYWGLILAQQESSKEQYVRPALILNSTTQITNGNGTRTNPYVIP